MEKLELGVNVSGPSGALESLLGMSNGAAKVEAMGQRDFHSAMKSIFLVAATLGLMINE